MCIIISIKWIPVRVKFPSFVYSTSSKHSFSEVAKIILLPLIIPICNIFYKCSWFDFKQNPAKVSLSYSLHRLTIYLFWLTAMQDLIHHPPQSHPHWRPYWFPRMPSSPGPMICTFSSASPASLVSTKKMHSSFTRWPLGCRPRPYANALLVFRAAIDNGWKYNKIKVYVHLQHIWGQICIHIT